MLKEIHISAPSNLNRHHLDYIAWDVVQEEFLSHVHYTKRLAMMTRSGASCITDYPYQIEALLSSCGFLVVIKEEKVSL